MAFQHSCIVHVQVLNFSMHFQPWNVIFITTSEFKSVPRNIILLNIPRYSTTLALGLSMYPYLRPGGT